MFVFLWTTWTLTPKCLNGSLIALFILLLDDLMIAFARVDRPRGVSIAMASLYNSYDYFTCLDGQKSINIENINDSICDCQDGSDEPGTSACPHAWFHCMNAGHQPLYIPSSRVNDEVCDCCDGSDEYSSSFECINNCSKLNEEEKEAQAADP